MLDNNFISGKELLSIFEKNRIDFNNHAKMELLSFIDDGLEPLFFYYGSILRKVTRFNIYDYKHILQYESNIDNVIGYFILNEYDFKDLLFNDITLLCYPITESENYPLVGSYLPSHSPEENDNDYCISFYTIDYELSFEDVLFDRKNLNKFLKLGELDKQTNNEIETLKKQLQQAHGEIDRLKAELEQAQALLAEKQKNEYGQSVQVVDNESLHPKTKTSHEKLIAVLASMAKLDFDKPFSNYDGLCLQSELLGMDSFLSKDTLAKLLNNAHKHINNSK